MTENTSLKTQTLKLNFLLSPWAVLCSAVAGAYIGIFYKSIVPYVAPYGQMYLSVLKMCILPVLVAAIASSMGRLRRSEVGGQYLRRMIVIFIVTMLVTSIVGVFIGVIGKPGKALSDKALSSLGTIVQTSRDQPDLEMNFYEKYIPPSGEKSIITGFFTNMIPSNIFHALSSGAKLQVLFFAILAGIAIGFIKRNSAEYMFSLLDAIYQTFSKVIHWLMYVLPFGLFCLTATQLSNVGFPVLTAMVKFVVVSFICFLMVFILCSLILWFRTGGSLFGVLSALKEPILIALATNNSLAAIPSTLNKMHEELKFEKRTIGLFIPLGITVCRFGPILYFSIATLFVVQLYQIDLDFSGLFIVTIGSVLAGMASAGSSGILSLAMLGLVLGPLGLPFDAVLVLFIAVDPVSGPLRSLTNVYVACCATAIIVPAKPDIKMYEGENERRDKKWDRVERRIGREA